MGISGVQLFLTPEYVAFDRKRLQEIRKMCADHGLEITAVCGDGASCRLGVTDEMNDRVNLFRRMTDIAKELGTGIVTSHIGVVPEDPADPVFVNMTHSLRASAEYALSQGGCIAVETGPEPAETLKRLLDAVDSGGIKVNFDPANLRMVSCVDPVRAVEVLGKYIVHTHAKDGINDVPGCPAARYGIYDPDGSPRPVHEKPPAFREVPLGEGQVPWDGYIAALKKIGYDGYFVVEREQGTTREADIRHGVEFLRSKLF